MGILSKLLSFIKTYLPMFLMICFSGNPIFTHMDYSKNLLVGYTLFFLIFNLTTIDLALFKKGLGILFSLIVFIFILVFFQRVLLGFVSYPGVLGYILKIILSFFTLLYYIQRKIDFLNTYIKILAYLAILSIPFWILDQFGFYGIQTDSTSRKTFLLYTSLLDRPYPIVRSSGMFWEPGAFAGYLILALVFIALKNRKFQIGPYKKEVLMILTGLITSMSTTGFIVFGIILTIYSFQNFRWGIIIIIPVLAVTINFAYNNLDFMKKKIEKQATEAREMDENDISANRMGALKMDVQYIKSQPFTGNGFHVKTRYRFHPWVKGDIGHGNGMSNIMATWGVPFFFIWIYLLYRFAWHVSRSYLTTFTSIFIIILILQGEQFINFSVFLSFFFLPFVYQNILSYENKIHILKTYFEDNSEILKEK